MLSAVQKREKSDDTTVTIRATFDRDCEGLIGAQWW